MAASLERAALNVKLAMAKSKYMSSEDTVLPARSLLRVIATDVHFWIPLAVLLAGLMLLDKLR